MTIDSTQNPGGSSRWSLWVMLAIAAMLTAVAGVMRPSDFFAAWLAAILWPWSVCIGALVLRLMYVLTGGHWGIATWPWIQATVRQIPLVGLLFIPWALGLHHLYSWADPQTFAGIENVAHRVWYFQPGFVILRMVGYFTLWSGLSILSAGLPWPWRKIDPEACAVNRSLPGGEAVAGLGLVAVLLSVTWASMDWVMSLDPFFMSTLFGALVGMGALLSGMAMVAFAYCRHIGNQPPDDLKALSDVANLLLAFVMLWAYLSFAQFLIMWSDNLPREAAFYQSRTQGLWNVVAVGLALGGFAIPLACLMSRNFKKSPHKVATAARINWAAVPVAVVVGCLWLLLPGGPLMMVADLNSQKGLHDV